MIRKSLDDAEQTWRDIARTEYALFAETPVVKAAEDPKKDRPWMFYTDGTTTHMDVFKPSEIQAHFKGKIRQLYMQAYGVPLEEKDIERMVHDNFTYLYFHEQFHPTYCPDSKSDEERIDEAIYRGIKKVEPHLSEPDVLRKVGNVRNAAWDQVIDTAFFYLSNYGNSLEARIGKVLEKKVLPLSQVQTLPDGVLTIFDVIEFENHKDKFETLFYPLSRAVYSFLFAESHSMRAPLYDYFKTRILKQIPERDYTSVMEKAVQGFVEELSAQQLDFAAIDKNTFRQRVSHALKNYNTPQGDSSHTLLIKDLAHILLDKRSRYDAIKGFIIPLSRYISLSKEEKRHGTHIGQGAGQGNPQTGQNQAGGNTEQALQNLANVLDPKEANNLLAAVANGTLGGTGKDARLHNLANDEYYKRNAKEIPIRSPDYTAQQVTMGKKRVPNYVSTRELGAEEIPYLPLEDILRFQEETGITQLFELTDHRWRYDLYEWIEKEDLDYTYDVKGLDVPENIIFHNDSSGSMGSTNYTGNPCSYNTLMHIETGLLKTIEKAATLAKKDPVIIAANFSNGTLVSEALPLSIVSSTPNNSVKTTMSGFQGGGTTYTPKAFEDIEKKCLPGKTVHILVTDGALEAGCVAGTLQKIEETLKKPDTSFVYFEIGTKSSFGTSLETLGKKYGNLRYYGNICLEDIEKKSLEVLVTYEQGTHDVLI